MVRPSAPVARLTFSRHRRGWRSAHLIVIALSTSEYGIFLLPNYYALLYRTKTSSSQDFLFGLDIFYDLESESISVSMYLLCVCVCVCIMCNVFACMHTIFLEHYDAVLWTALITN